jgi:hypothetical protein
MTNSTEKTTMETSMQSCIDYAKTWKVKEPWMVGALNDDIETLVETMNMWVSNPNPFWQNKFIKVYKKAQSLKQS